MMQDSKRIFPASLITGTLPYGFSFKNSGRFWSFLARSSVTRSYARPFSCKAIFVRSLFDDGTASYNVMAMAFLPLYEIFFLLAPAEEGDKGDCKIRSRFIVSAECLPARPSR